MARGQKTDARKVDTVLRVWVETGNMSEAGRQAGVSETTAQDLCRKHRDGERVAELRADALARAREDDPAITLQATRLLRAALSKGEAVLNGDERAKGSDVFQLGRLALEVRAKLEPKDEADTSVEIHIHDTRGKTAKLRLAKTPKAEEA